MLGLTLRISALSYLHSVLAAAALPALHEVATHRQHGLDALRVGGELGLERLVLLVLGLDVGRVLATNRTLNNLSAKTLH